MRHPVWQLLYIGSYFPCEALCASGYIRVRSDRRTTTLNQGKMQFRRQNASEREDEMRGERRERERERDAHREREETVEGCISLERNLWAHRPLLYNNRGSSTLALYISILHFFFFILPFYRGDWDSSSLIIRTYYVLGVCTREEWCLLFFHLWCLWLGIVGKTENEMTRWKTVLVGIL